MQRAMTGLVLLGRFRKARSRSRWVCSPNFFNRMFVPTPQRSLTRCYRTITAPIKNRLNSWTTSGQWHLISWFWGECRHALAFLARCRKTISWDSPKRTLQTMQGHRICFHVAPDNAYGNCCWWDDTRTQEAMVQSTAAPGYGILWYQGCIVTGSNNLQQWATVQKVSLSYPFGRWMNR